MHPHLEAARDEIARVAGPIPIDVLVRPVPGAWSIAEILEHLTLAYRYSGEAIEKAIARGEPRGREPILRQRLARRLVIDLGYFPQVKAPESTTPQRSIPPDHLVSAARDGLAVLDVSLSRAESAFGGTRAITNHPYFAGLTVPQWRKFHWRHTVHHMRQVARRTRLST